MIEIIGGRLRSGDREDRSNSILITVIVHGLSCRVDGQALPKDHIAWNSTASCITNDLSYES